MIIETVLVLVIGMGGTAFTEPDQCQPEEVCYPIDPNPSKPPAPNCLLDEEGNLTCYPVDESGKWK